MLALSLSEQEDLQGLMLHARSVYRAAPLRVAGLAM